MADVCTIAKAREIQISFVATINIPVGFKIIGTGDDPVYPYTTKISIDKTYIRSIIGEELRSAEITIPELNAEQPGEMTTMTCESKVRTWGIRGPLFYNAIVSGFVPQEPLQPGNPDQLVAPTAFSSSETIEINETLAYMCYECEIPENLLQGFDIEVVQKTEFIIDAKGNTIYYNKQEPAPFIYALQGETAQVIHVPYTLTIKPRTSI